MAYSWRIVFLILMAPGIRCASAEEVWLMITSNLPGASITVDDIYRGTTSQQSHDGLAIQVPEGVRVISARQRLDGQDYTAQQTIEAAPDQQNQVRLDLQSKSEPVVMPAPVFVTPLVQFSKVKPEQTLPRSEPPVPGKNF